VWRTIGLNPYSGAQSDLAIEFSEVIQISILEDDLKKRARKVAHCAKEVNWAKSHRTETINKLKKSVAEINPRIQTARALINNLCEAYGRKFVWKARYCSIKQFTETVFGISKKSNDLLFIQETIKKLNENVLSMPKGFQRGSSMISILFLAADPTDASRLRLGREFREIDEQLRLARQRDNFKLELPQLSLRTKDISGSLLNAQPQIVHFSGHGTSTGTLCFENETGEIQEVRPDALAALFEQFANQVNCVLLNACYSKPQAEAIAKHIKVVG
jgi:hypothetical protein